MFNSKLLKLSRRISLSLLVGSAVMLNSAAMPAQAQSAWDGISKKEADHIVTLRTTKEPDEILLNGEPAQIFKDAPSGTVKVLIPSDASGTSCENIFTVKFSGDKAGQLIANHCHGDEVFDVRPGEIIDKRLTKEDVDNPDDDDAAGNSIAFEWSANGFIEMDKELKWAGYGGRNAGMSFSVPETDAFFWITQCKNGQAWNYIQMSSESDLVGSRDFIQFETNNSPLAGYNADVVLLPFGDGDGTDTTTLLKLPPENELFADMAKASWLYIQRGNGDDAIKRRLSLSGSAAAIRAFQSGCGKANNSSSSAPPLSAYSGKYAFNEVNGVSMLQHPVYRAGVAAAVSNKDDRKWLLDDGTTMGPIEYKGGSAIISACERHNCGNRNWTTIIDVDSGYTQVCFHETRGILNRHIRYTPEGRRPMGANEKCES